MNELLKVSYLFAPLLLGLAFHGFCIKYGWLAALARPLDRGKTFSGVRLFGENKTWRGLVAVGLGTAAGLALQVLLLRDKATLPADELGKASVIGFLVGVAAMLSELPNSFIKRRLDIAPGKPGRGWRGVLFYLFDQVDLLLGAWLVLACFVPVTVARVLWSVVFLFLAHQLITVIGYGLGMRATPR
jgi:hypothetical protein